MPLTVQNFQVDGMTVKSDVRLSKQDFDSRLLGALYAVVSVLDPLPTLDQVDYVKVENGVASLVLK